MRVSTCFSMFPVTAPEHLYSRKNSGMVLRLGASVHSVGLRDARCAGVERER